MVTYADSRGCRRKILKSVAGSEGGTVVDVAIEAQSSQSSQLDTTLHSQAGGLRQSARRLGPAAVKPKPGLRLLADPAFERRVHCERDRVDVSPPVAREGY
jgi:hypothetical protein